MNRVERVHQTTHDEVAEGRKKNINSKNTKSIQQFSAGCLSLLLLFWYDSHTVTHTHKQTHLEFDIPTDTTKMHIQHSLPKLT